MASIYIFAKKGTLTESQLQGFDSKGLDHFDSTDKTTPLGIAVREKHFATARLLLEYGADPNCGGKGILPLMRLCAAPKGLANHEESLIQLLLEKGADPNIIYLGSAGKSSTPLIRAVKSRKSLDTIKCLVDHGAMPNEKVDGKSARDWTKNPQVLNAMLSRSERMKSRALEVAKVTGFLMSAVYWINRNIKVAASVGAAVGTGMVLKDAIGKRFGMSGKLHKDLEMHFAEDQAFEDAKEDEKHDLKNRMRGIIEHYKLDRFFPEGNPFLEHVVSRAVDLDVSTVVDPKDLVHLALYQPVLYCDDSKSIKTKGRKGSLHDLALRIASITTRLVPDDKGVELRFINKPTTGEMSKPSLEKVDEILTKLTPHGWTEIGTKLKTNVLEEYVYKHLENNTLERPILVSIITDGNPNGQPGSNEHTNTLKEAIQDCGKRLEVKGYARNVVRFQISQIGGDKEAVEFLDNLENDPGLKDVLYVTSQQLDSEFKELHDNEARLEQWLLQILMGPIVDAVAN
ncbi:hypothetical protein P170DRAFT_481320 [Aspergillus steynii IBT 23096]|uniref:Uncharacterized protein n=1 Tax=Aspergillus steynii IBT 23096 TaxID=1392250 RepID=A0A2I2FRX5_9EURO|nr:uncharacterized protein P170DRAFT_481320 [Aspergillus steynii IBT 23096]PLB43373.1 hypothetical protein P170DRAFT_481320 [Aspergillus steynii IBT 23096]